MVRAVIGDETYVEGFIDSVLQSGITLQVGLAVGRVGIGSGRDAVFALIPTPQNEGQEVAHLEGESAKELDKRKGTKGKSPAQSLQIDMDWVAEHARQVSKMLVGGIRVVGCFILASESVFKSSAALLWQTSKMVALALDASFNKLSLDDLLLMHFSFSPRRVSCKNCSFELGYGSSSFRPCEWRAAKTLSGLHSISCLYRFECRAPVYAKEPTKKRLLDTLLSAVDAETTRLEAALVLSDGSLVVEDKALIGDTDHEVEMFLPFDCPPTDIRNGEVSGLAIVSGSIQAHAYGFSRDPWSRAASDLKADIVKSLRSRLEILHDEIDNFSKDVNPITNGEHTVHPLQRVEGTSEFRCKLPRRLLFPWLEGVFLCDYLQEGESLQDVDGRLKDLLHVNNPLDQGRILQHENDVEVLMRRSFWEASVGNANIHEDKRKQAGSISNAVSGAMMLKAIGVLSFCVLLVSIIASYFITVRKKSAS
ncbi:hypothetical protein GOP47_0002560 [Adiantum capillus-veneris]|uniref:Uncharacterized protein n=1 Tax=Adiantum capillus-veneris TaxID=13818 RepID=A0A9D4VAW5_ADICA|nr:hypothetical protein GOP47_0002560 [Adiantum capillus-veneris]